MYIHCSVTHSRLPSPYAWWSSSPYTAPSISATQRHTPTFPTWSLDSESSPSQTTACNGSTVDPVLACARVSGTQMRTQGSSTGEGAIDTVYPVTAHAELSTLVCARCAHRVTSKGSHWMWPIWCISRKGDTTMIPTFFLLYSKLEAQFSKKIVDIVAILNYAGPVGWRLSGKTSTSQLIRNRLNNRNIPGVVPSHGLSSNGLRTCFLMFNPNILLPSS